MTDDDERAATRAHLVSRALMLAAAVLVLVVGVALVTSSGSLAGLIAWGLAFVACFVAFQVSVVHRKRAATKLAEVVGVAPPLYSGPRSALSSTFAAAFGSAAVAAFLAFDDLVSAGGAGCEVYCGPGSILLPSAVGLLALAFWVAAVTLGVVTIRTERSIVLRVAAIAGALALPIAVVWALVSR